MTVKIMALLTFQKMEKKQTNIFKPFKTKYYKYSDVE